MMSSELKSWVREAGIGKTIKWEQVGEKILKEIEECKIKELKQQNENLVAEIEGIKRKSLEERMLSLEKESEEQKRKSFSPRREVRC